MNNFEKHLNTNKNLWNNKVSHHIESDFYKMDNFLAGNTSLNSIELDLLGNNELSQLNFTELDHSYNSVNVKNGLTDSLFNGKIIYNLLVKKQLYYSGLLTDTTQTEKSVNIAYNNPTSLNGVRYSELKPSIKLLSIIASSECKQDSQIPIYF